MATLGLVLLAYLLIGLGVSLWSWFRYKESLKDELDRIQERLDYPQGVPFSIRVAKFIANLLVFALGALFWPLSLRNHLRGKPHAQVEPRKPAPRVLRQPPPPWDDD
ncbi:hypothetical protein F2Q65_09355 [Thiohalocapsa marina]|uniref:Uncharacterized protein n=1 Tax=Thiohalocapsa marina TaxID=424902 RepID=A0A5M8FNQ9_9GAMM|nr:hypothetical protein [Thiohalocapsa marina]KAA6185296.1 hypothetical protein F2Q65_09355 [Thiohalocapsa marina]